MESSRSHAADIENAETMVPRRWVHATVSSSMHCRNCGYDLRGLDASARCPECGLDIWSTVIHSVDPASSRLPSVRNPIAVGNSLLVLTLCMFLGALLMVLPTVAQAIDDFRGPARGMEWWHRLPGLHWPYATFLMVCGAWALITLAPPRGSEPYGAVWDDIWRIGVGYAGWLICATMLARSAEVQEVTSRHPRLVLGIASSAFGVIGLLGLRGTFAIIGQRSREYRRLQGGRQSIGLIIIAIIGAAIGHTLTSIAHMEWLRGWAGWRFTFESIGRVVFAMGMFMALIGLAYLVMNGWWIRQALRMPPPAMDEVLLPRMPNDTWLPDREA